MAVIVQQDEPSLRTVAKPVPEALFGSSELSRILRDMEQALDEQPDGVALAAPQIGIPYRIFIVRYDRTLPPPPEGEPQPPPDIGIYINPEFVRSSKRRVEMDEGCLSVRGIYGKTRRYNRITVRAQTEDGTPFERGAGGIVAQIFQHEIDHLEGILFIDHATDLVEVRKDAPEHA